jgi:S-adenosylmethionine decarboxylase
MIQTHEADFGLHLTIDAQGCDYGRLLDVERVRHFLHDLPEVIGMVRIIPAYAFPYHGKVHDDWGVTGMVLIAESHMSLHTFPVHRYLFFDAFSCKGFDTEGVILRLQEEFDPERIDPQIIIRGRGFRQGFPAAPPFLPFSRRAFCGGGGNEHGH